jgi:hypothetical protein
VVGKEVGLNPLLTRNGGKKCNHKSHEPPNRVNFLSHEPE